MQKAIKFAVSSCMLSAYAIELEQIPYVELDQLKSYDIKRIIEEEL